MCESTGKHVIPLSEPEISGNEWKYVKECLDTGWVSSAGKYVTRFEEMVASYAGTKYAVATVNGTAALHTSLIACGIGPDDEVIVPTLTFVAPVNAVRYCGAYPVFMDCDADTLCMDVEKFADFIKNGCEQRDQGHVYNKKTNRRVKAVLPVHIFGHPVDMKMLADICSSNNIGVIEDATESIGSEYDGKKTGSFGKTGCFSFNGNKIITTGGGGMVVTDSRLLSDRVRHLTTQAKTGTLEYDHDEIGYNYRLTNIQAAIGVAQMERLDEFISIKRKNAMLYSELLGGVEEVEFIGEKPRARSNFWFYTIKVVRGEKGGLMEHLLSKNINVRPVWKLIHTLPMYRGCQAYAVEKAPEAYDCCLNLPCSAGLKEDQLRRVVEAIKAYFSRI